MKSRVIQIEPDEPARTGETADPRRKRPDRLVARIGRWLRRGQATRMLVASAAVGGAVACGGVASAQAGGPALGPCAELPDLPQAQCGTLDVPLDRADPSRGTTTVAFALVPRGDLSKPSLGTIVPNPGGPGLGVIASGPDYAQAFAPLLRRRELLLVDPRGTGRSNALTCTAFQNGLLSPEGKRVASGPFIPLTELVGDCGRELGPQAAFYGSAAVVDDVDAVRASLGIERLDLWGASYGTYLWPVYAARHPEHVRSIVLSGAYPIEFDSWGRDRLDAARRAIRLVCDRADACRGEKVLRDLARLAAQLREHPVSFTMTAGTQHFRARLDEAALASLVFSGGDSTAFGRIPAAVASALAGDDAPLRRLVETRLLRFGAIFAQLPPTYYSLGQNFATQCHDYPRAFSYADTPAGRRAAYEEELAAIPPAEFFPFSPAAWTRAGFEGVDTCIEWPDDPTAASPFPPGTAMPDVPVLVLSGDLDANTPTSAGRQAAAQFAHATLVEIPNEGHPPTGSACARAVVNRFIATFEVNPSACEGTGTRPTVANRAPRRAAELPLVRADATHAQRRALGLVVTTAGDLLEQAVLVQLWGSARGLRGGSYVARGETTIGLVDVRVVRDARVSGELALGADGTLAGTLRLSGTGVPNGELDVRLTPQGRGRATGSLAGQPVDIAFRS